MPKKVPVSIISGYLGAGKTTLLKKIIENTDRKIAILMNEFGEIGIDAKIVKGANIDIKELLGGCVCCSLTGEFEAAIQEILKRIKPEMIIVETTGVAEPDAIMLNLEDMKEVYLDSVITLVDAEAFLKFPKLGHTGKVQIESADIILLNKMDLVKTGKIDEMQHTIQTLNPSAKIIKTTYANVDTNSLFGIGFERVLKKKHEVHALEIFESFVFASDKIFHKGKFVEFIPQIPKKIYRVKGFIRFIDGVYLFNFVNGRYELTKFNEKDATKIFFIGEKISALEDKVSQDLKGCEM